MGNFPTFYHNNFIIWWFLFFQRVLGGSNYFVAPILAFGKAEKEQSGKVRIILWKHSPLCIGSRECDGWRE